MGLEGTQKGFDRLQGGWGGQGAFFSTSFMERFFGAHCFLLKNVFFIFTRFGSVPFASM